MKPRSKPGPKKFPPQRFTQPLPRLDSTPAQTSSGLDEEAENQFELELCWCIQQLQESLHSGQMSEKQQLEIRKKLQLLNSDSVVLIKKRQIMRNTFGDYRDKMALEEKKHGKYIKNAKILTAETSKPKCMFLKKAAAGSKEENVPDEDSNGTNSENSTNDKPFVMSKKPSDVPFKFNFSEPKSE